MLCSVCVCVCVCVCVSYIGLVLFRLLPLIFNVGDHLLQFLVLATQGAVGLGSFPGKRTRSDLNLLKQGDC